MDRDSLEHALYIVFNASFLKAKYIAQLLYIK